MRNESTLTDECFDELVQLGMSAWKAFAKARGGAFHYLIPADFAGARATLASQRATSDSFLELGSGVGVITIMADLMGYDASGIEIEPELVHTSRSLAERFDSKATFAEGSFVPPEYREDVELMSPDFLTLTEGADAYEELGFGLEDFDLVYAYVWPGEEEWMAELLRQHAGTHTKVMQYSTREGFEVGSPNA